MSIELQAYHGTDLDAALQIRENGFSFERSNEHWMGNGSYFYFDYSLAKWWTKKPSKKFGHAIHTPAIIQCTIQILEDDFMNLQSLKDYQIFTKDYVEIFLPRYIKGIKPFPRNVDNSINFKVLRCQYCDFLAARYGLKAVCGSFFLPKQPYLPEKSRKVIDQFQIAYTELQLCVFEPQLITVDSITNLLTGKEV